MAEALAQRGVIDCREVARGMYLEGLAIDNARGLIWYSDVIAGGVHGVQPDGTKRFSFNGERMWTGGLLLNADGAVLSSGPDGIMWNRPEDGTGGWLVRDIPGAPYSGVNEMTSDGAGGLYFGTVDVDQIVKGEPTRPASLYHLSVAGELELVADQIGFANGIMLSPDGSRLYCNATFDATYVFPVEPGGSLGERKKLLDKDDCDGMALDTEGNLLVTGYKSGQITRLSPEGELIGSIPTPAEAITQIRLAGRDGRDVYLNSVPLDAGDGLAVGDSPTEPRSVLICGRLDVSGLEMALPRFNL